jgi:hypothetical protein
MVGEQLNTLYYEINNKCPIKTFSGKCTANIGKPEPGAGDCTQYDCPFVYWLKRFLLEMNKEG